MKTWLKATLPFLMILSIQLTSGSKSCEPSAIMGMYINSCRFRRAHQDAGRPFRLWKATVTKNDLGSGSGNSNTDDMDDIAETEIIEIITKGIYYVEKEEIKKQDKNAIRRMDNSRRLLKRNDAISVVSKCCNSPTGCRPEDFSHLC